VNRKEITKKLSEILITDRLSGAGKYWAKEVTLDYGTSHPIRVDYMQYTPNGAIFASDIENGYFTCFEVKSCKADVYSGNGLNFIAEKNYIVTTMGCYKELLPDIRSGKLSDYIREANGRSVYWDILVAIPDYEIIDSNRKSGYRKIEMEDEFDNPTPIESDVRWRLVASGVGNRHDSYRTRSKVELLFCMLRAGRE
jgi:hypothetical protein